ncbi:BIR protein [Cardiosporidium cionae]|uniref:BIR protein n=1 Tax=Cardiosporidium cionae TaxID=476202 RepID=A0ABQ7JEP2_9APIC|nr:BIR protein [Cardiosporidium cionae]|eukprot:KAF8822477.1 BIR protein [Cardiosporidium cionae]
MIVDRAIREVPSISRYDLLKGRVKPRYFKECKGTPRQEYQENIIGGIRVKPTFNPYVSLNKKKRYFLDNYASRNWDDWNPKECYVRGSQRRYKIPEDMKPLKDELGEWHPPKLSKRYVADIRKQYLLNGLPWVWDKFFYAKQRHFGDREPIVPKIPYLKELRCDCTFVASIGLVEVRTKEALMKMNDLVFEYRKQSRERRNPSWLDKMAEGMAGAEVARDFTRKKKEAQ